jgi:hypothetical protein
VSFQALVIPARMWDVRGFRIAVRDAGLALRWDHYGRRWSTSVEPVINDAVLAVQGARPTVENPQSYVSAVSVVLTDRAAFEAAVLLGGARAAVDYASSVLAEV